MMEKVIDDLVKAAKHSGEQGLWAAINLVALETDSLEVFKFLSHFDKTHTFLEGS